MKTKLFIVSICLAALCLNASESWHFLPNFQCDVRGVEKASKNDVDFFGSLPTSVEKLLSADSPLTDSQRDELYWRPAELDQKTGVIP